MSSFYDITTCLKSRQFVKATNLLKEYQRDIDGRSTFKLLRSLAAQLKINSSNKEDEDCVNEFVQACCATLDQSQDLTADDTEFTQGVLSLYHLVTLSLSSPDKSDICVLLSKTILVCLRKIDKSLKDVQSIAANLFSQIWSVANKVSSELCFSYRSVALLILVHGGNNFWNRLIEKLTFIVQEPCNTSFQLVGSVFDEVLLYCNYHKVKGSFFVSSLLQVWTHLVLLSNSSNLHQDRTSKLKLFAKEIEEIYQLTSLIELVLNLFEVSDVREVDFSPQKWNNLLDKDFQVAFIRISIVTLNYLNVVLNQSEETKWDQTNQLISVINLLLYIFQEGDHLASVVEANMQMDPINFRIKCLTRACSASFHLIKIDFSKVYLSQTVFYHIDKFKKQGIVEQNKSSSNYLYSAEIYANNIGVVSLHRSDYVNAVIHFRKALEYHIMSVSETKLFNGEVPNNFATRMSSLYDSRKATRDWNGITEDFALCFSAFYDYNETNVKVRCNSPAIEHLLVAWSRFKREIHHCSTSSNERFLEMTVLDLFKQTSMKLDNDSAWNLLFEEYQTLDQRIGSMPKAAFNAVAQQASALAKSSFQKGVSSFFQSRVGEDFVERHKAAKKAIAKLALQTTVTDSQSLSQVYLALAYLEVYVSQQELLKKKTEEEMESLGPLIQSSSNVDVRPGEDGTHSNSDGTSLDAVSYSYLKLELELKNQDWMVKCLQQWEELVQFGWYPKQYSNQIFNCIKSLGYYFSLIGNSFFSARAWSVLLKLAESAKNNEDLVQSASELLKLGWKVDSGVLTVCQNLIEKHELLIQDQVLFHLSMAWSKYFQHNFAEAWQVLDEQVLQSSVITTETPSKSVLLLISQANLLRSLLAVLPEELSHIPPSEDTGPVQAAVKAAQTAYTALKCYTVYAHQQRGWEYYGQEWNYLGHFLVGAINVSRIYLYIAAPREARFFLKEALNASQKHVSVLRTAEALLELCNLDLMLDNTIDCQSKLVLICHLMGVAPPVIPDSENIAPSAGKKSFETPVSPVQIRVDRRKGIAARKVPEIPIQMQQDATQRALQLPLNHQGASPTTKAREVSDGIFPEHISDCICLTCSSELIMSIRCSSLLVQSKLWSLLGFQDLANEDFFKGHQLVQSICSRLKSSTKSVVGKSSSKRLFDVPDCLNINETWTQYKMNWFQPPIVTGMELLLENAMHRLVTESINITSSELLAPVKAIMYEFYLGPLEHRVIKLTSAIATISLQQPATCFLTPEQKCKSNEEEEDDDVIILEGDLAPKTPAIGLRKPLEIPAPRRVRRNLMAVKVDDTITIDDDEDSDGGFSRRRLGKPQKAIVYSSDSDSDIIPPTPSPPPKIKKTKAVVGKKKTQEMTSPTVEFTIQPVKNKYPSRGTLKSSDSKKEDLDIAPVKEKRSSVKTKSYSQTTSSSNAPAEADLDLQQPAASATAKVEKRFFKSKTASSSSSSKKEVEVNDLSSRLAATKINPENTEETRPKRTTRSTRK